MVSRRCASLILLRIIRVSWARHSTSAATASVRCVPRLEQRRKKEKKDQRERVRLPLAKAPLAPINYQRQQCQLWLMAYPLPHTHTHTIERIAHFNLTAKIMEYSPRNAHNAQSLPQPPNPFIQIKVAIFFIHFIRISFSSLFIKSSSSSCTQKRSIAIHTQFCPKHLAISMNQSISSRSFTRTTKENDRSGVRRRDIRILRMQSKASHSTAGLGESDVCMKFERMSWK